MPRSASTPITRRGWFRGLLVLLVLAMIGLFIAGLWALGQQKLELALVMMVAGSVITFILIILTLVISRKSRAL